MSTILELQQEKNEQNTKQKFIKDSLYKLNEKILNDHPELSCDIKSKTPNNALEDFLKHYPKAQWWRLFVDGALYAKQPPSFFWPVKNNKILSSIAEQLGLKDPTWEKPFKGKEPGWLAYEGRERNATLSNLKALTYALSQIGKDRDEIKFIKHIHHLLASEIVFFSNINPGKFKNSRNGLFLGVPDLYDMDGLKDLVKQVQGGNLPYAYFSAQDVTEAIFKSEGAHKYNKIKEIIADAYFEYDKLLFDRIEKELTDDYASFINDFCTEILKKKTPLYYATFAKPLRRSQIAFCLKDKEFKLLSNTERHYITNQFQHYEPDAPLIKYIIGQLPKRLIVALLDQIQEVLFVDPIVIPDMDFQKQCQNHLLKLLNQDHMLKSLLEESGLENDPDFSISYKPFYDLFLSRLLLEHVMEHLAVKILHKHLDEIVNNTFRFYHNEICKDNLSDDDKLKLIGKTIQTLQRIHPFMDANGRAFVNILSTVLLIENGFPPATFYQPNLFDANSGLVAILKRGIANTIEVYEAHKRHEEINLFGFKTDDGDQFIRDEVELQKADGQDSNVITELQNRRMTTILKKLSLFCPSSTNLHKRYSSLEDDDLINHVSSPSA